MSTYHLAYNTLCDGGSSSPTSAHVLSQENHCPQSKPYNSCLIQPILVESLTAIPFWIR